MQTLGVLAQVLQATVANVTARTLCAMGDSLITEETGKVFKNKKDMKKGEIQLLMFKVIRYSCVFRLNTSRHSLQYHESSMILIPGDHCPKVK